MDIKERIKQYMDAKNISTNMLETTIGISSGGFRKVKTLSSEFISEFAKTYPNVSLDWLLRGEGDMEKTVKEETEYSDISTKELFEQIKLLNKTIFSQQETIRQMQIEKEKLLAQLGDRVTCAAANG